MHFTVIFDTGEASDASYGLVFVPSPIWIKGAQNILILNPDDPAYQKGSIRKLLKLEKLSSSLTKAAARCTIVAHSEGHGTLQDFTTLIGDLESEGFQVAIHRS